MKKSLLATVAAVALIAGAGFASAAEGAKDHGMGAAPATKSEASPTGRSEPAMKQGADIKSGAQLKGHSETTGAGAGAEMKSEPKADMKADGKADTKAKPSTTGQADQNQRSAPSRSSAEEKSSPNKANESQSGRSAADSKMGNDNKKMGSDNKMGGDSKSNAAMENKDSKGGAGASANLTTEQKTKIRTSVIQSSNAPKVSRSSINFNISVGTVVPRSVHFVTVPETIIEIHPAWRGYSYFVVDDEIIIVEPRTLKIIAVLAV